MTLPSFRLDEQTALVTGAASGIGRGIALGLAAAGANVACFDLPESALDEVCGEIGEAGRGAIAVPGDVMDADMLADAVRDAESEFGPLILAVNSAGIANAARAEEMSLSQWQRVIDINVTGVFCLARQRARPCLGTAEARS
jgi:NAD(P)-dependent dehydrogenase (short-subunit alcohol dehydrogenase family)